MPRTLPAQTLRAGVRSLLVAGLLCACSAAPTGGERPLVLVSVGPQRYFVERLAGPWVEVRAMLPPGASPVLYEPSWLQLRDVRRAVLYVKLGHPHFPFEGTWLLPLLEERPDLAVLDAGAGGADGDDPHTWLVPRAVRAGLGPLADALSAALPGRGPAIQSRRGAFERELEVLDSELRARLAPLRGSEFFVFHPAWGHFAAEYGLRQTAVEREHKAPDVAHLAALIERARAERVRVLFVQPQFDPEAARVIAEEIGAHIEPLDALASDWPANLRRAARRLAGTRS